MKREVVGFFADELSAVIAVSDNAGGLQNDLLVIEEIPFGFNQTPVSAQWFKRDVEGDYYYPVEIQGFIGTSRLHREDEG